MAGINLVVPRIIDGQNQVEEVCFRCNKCTDGGGRDIVLHLCCRLEETNFFDIIAAVDEYKAGLIEIFGEAEDEMVGAAGAAQ